MTCFGNLGWDTCLKSTNGENPDTTVPKQLLSSVYTSSKNLLFAHFPLDKDDYQCVITISPQLYCFQGELATHLEGNLILFNGTKYIQLTLDKTMYTFGEDACHICLNNIKVPVLNRKTSTIEYNYLQGELRFKFLIQEKPRSHNPSKKHYKLNCLDILCNHRAAAFYNIHIKGKFLLKNDICEKINSEISTTSLSQEHSESATNNVTNHVTNHVIDDVITAFYSKNYIEVDGFFGNFDWITISIKPRGADKPI